MAPFVDDTTDTQVAESTAEETAAQKKAKAIKKVAAKKKSKVSNKIAEFKKATALFSHSLKEEDFDSAQKIRTDLLENDNQSHEVLDKIKINTNSLFKNNFQFPEVAKNDFAAELFDGLEIAEKNLNSNLDNVDLYNTFVETAENVKKQLKEKYSDQWTDPADGSAPKPEDD